MNKIPRAYRNKGFDELEGDTMKKIAAKLKTWDAKSPLVCSIVSNQNGIGKTHLAVGLIKELYLKKIKALEEVNYEIYEERHTILCERDEYSKIKEEDRDIFSDDPFNKMLPRFNENYHLHYEFIPERKLLMEYKASTNFKSDTTEENFYKKYGIIPLLVIDDAFSTKEGNFEMSRSVLFSILDERMHYTMNPTIITSNLALKEIADIDTRIASRINNSMLIEITSKQEDYRGRD